MKSHFITPTRIFFLVIIICSLVPLNFLYSWFASTYNVRECLPIGDSDSDAFATGRIKSSSIKKITIYLYKDQKHYTDYIDCKKIKTLRKIEISDNDMIFWLNNALLIQCYSQECASKRKMLDREYAGYVIAELNKGKVVYLAFRINRDRSTLIGFANRIFQVATNESILGEDFCNLLLPDLQKLE